MRKNTRTIQIGDRVIGGGNPILIQSMTNTKTEDIKATVEQIQRLTAAGCEIIRCTVPTIEAAEALTEIKKQITIPLVADIHFDYHMAIAAIEHGADKIRINPGNIGSPDRVEAVASVCKERHIPIRVGVNGGSLEKELLAKYGGPTPEAMVESALGHIRLLERYGFEDICVSVKASRVPVTMKAYRLMAELYDYPLHLGVTEAGTREIGELKAAAGIGGLLALGIGDTLRVSLTADPVEEVYAARRILKAIGLRREGPEVIACPTCGRTQIELIPIAMKVEELLKGVDKPITVAVMGCVVNGPGEARHADVGLAGGKSEGVLFRRGEIVARVPEDQLVPGLMKLIENL